jgi:hypothetical protein
MPVDLGKASFVQGALEASINNLKAANNLLVNHQDPLIAMYSAALTQAFDNLSGAFKALGEILVQLADEATNARLDMAAMHAKAVQNAGAATGAQEDAKRSPFGPR